MESIDPHEDLHRPAYITVDIDYEPTWAEMREYYDSYLATGSQPIEAIEEYLEELRRVELATDAPAA
jgi:hypothetical protein